MAKPKASYHDPSHHRTSTKPHKPFKGRHGHKSKSTIKAISKGKIEKENTSKAKMHVPSKIERRNTQKQIVKSKKEEQARNVRFFGGARGAARIVAVVSLCPDIDPRHAILGLNASVDVETSFNSTTICSAEIPRFKQSLQYILPASSSITDILDACLPADYILLLLSATVEVPGSSLNTLRSILGQGTPSIIPVVANLSAHSNVKLRSGVKKSLLTYIQQYVPNAEKVLASDDRGEAATIMRQICSGVPQGIRWREQRSYILPEGWRWDETENAVVFWGTIRGMPLHVDCLINLPPYGDFQIEKICSLPDTRSKMIKNGMEVDVPSSNMDVNPVSTILAQPSSYQDSLSTLASQDEEMNDDSRSLHSRRSQAQKGVRIDDHYYFSDEEPQDVKKSSQNDYKAAWYISDSEQDDEHGEDDEHEIEMEDVSDDEPDVPYREDEGTSEMADTVSEMHVDLSPEEDAKQYTLFKAREEEARFPDEVEFAPEIPARTRFARYRALKSFRTSNWDLDEPDDDRAPTQWSRLVRFRNWRGTCSRIAQESSIGGIEPGVRVQVYLRSCPREVLSQPPRGVYSLLKHEHKYTTLNCTITTIPMDDEDDEGPVIKSKDILVVQYASRRYECRPVFSQPLAPSSENSLRKFERYLQPGRTSVASWLGPTVIGKDLPILFFKRTIDGLQLVATGSLMAPTPPIIVKRAILTGHPYRVHKKVVTMRYMFFNREDVLFFKPVQLVSKQGRRGWIKEPLGTHGYFKATFDGKMDKQDTVGMSLYKRIWPKLGV